MLLALTAQGITASCLNQPIAVEALRPRLREAATAGHPQILLRMGRADVTAELTPRRGLESVTLGGPV